MGDTPTQQGGGFPTALHGSLQDGRLSVRLYVSRALDDHERHHASESTESLTQEPPALIECDPGVSVASSLGDQEPATATASIGPLGGIDAGSCVVHSPMGR